MQMQMMAPRRIRLGMICVLLATGISIVQAQSNNVKTAFSCQGRPSGYYADVQSGCQIYHMCDGLGRQFSYSCPNTTLFQQRMLICDHWYMVNCSKSEDDYTANLLIGQREKPFVEDSDENPYHRTPRPDLLAHPSASEYNIIYRIGRAQAGSNRLNLVGVDTEGDTDNSAGVDGSKEDKGPAYFLPSHWSTEYKKSDAVNEIRQGGIKRLDADVSQTVPVDVKPSGRQRNPQRSESRPIPAVNFKSTYRATTPVYPSVLDAETQRRNNFDFGQLQTRDDSAAPLNQQQAQINFNSDFQATTPVYPTHVDDDVKAKNDYDFGQGPPLTRDERIKPPAVNFQSNFRATTPVYPEFVDDNLKRKHNDDFEHALPSYNDDSGNPGVVAVNFRSDFKATTPVYPKEVDPSVHLAGGGTFFGVAEGIAETIVPPRLTNTPSQPSIMFEAPGFNNNGQSSRGQHRQKPPETEKQWQDLRSMFLIPDYEFPLETITRPAYESKGPSSFQVNTYLRSGQNRKK